MKSDLLQFSDQGGCSAKIPPRQLEEILHKLPLPVDPEILVGIDTHDDAGVYKVNDELALVFTTDFFPPVCSDPFEFGEIAAANSISDVYAMGGTPVIALNIMMFPASMVSGGEYAEILNGGYKKATEAGVSIIGGHTIDDSVPKYGMAVVGYVHPGKIITNSGAKPGDLLILTKPVGTGVILAGHRLGMAADPDLSMAIEQMKLLNASGAAVMRDYGIKGATDITGFGLAGHALKMARASGVSITIRMGEVPLLNNALKLARQGCIPGACFTNLEYAEAETCFEDGLDYSLKMLAFDAQTSGGLLICAPETEAGNMIQALRSNGLDKAAIIGEVSGRRERLLYISG